MTLYWYVLRRFTGNLVKVQFIILGIILLFDTVDLVQRMKGTASASEIAGLSMIRVPAISSQTFPLVILIATLWTFLAFARSSELIVSRAAGVSGPGPSGVV